MNVREVEGSDALLLEDVLDALSGCAEQLGIETYLVGGFVRDRLLGAISKDIDLVVVGDDVMELLTAIATRFGWHPPERFVRFGTAQVRGSGFVVEAVRARAERYDPDSRNPSVAPGTLEQDVWRRDFTVNALCQTFDGRVIDITGSGIDDLRAGVLRTPLDPAETFSEDPLRMFRAARFAAQLDFVLAGGVIEAMRTEAARSQILSVERISEELRRLLTSAHPRQGIEVLREASLLEEVLPELLGCIGVEQGGFHRYDVYDHTLHALDAAPPNLIARTATLLHDIGKPVTHVVRPDGQHTFYDHPQIGAEMARQILTRLRFSNDEIAAVTRLIRLHLRPIQYERDAFSDAAVRRLIRDAGELRNLMLDVARADTTASSYPTLAGLDELAARMARLDSGGAVSAMRDPLTGDDVMAMAGRGPGPWVGRVKSAVRDAVIEGTIPPDDADAARRFLESRPELLSAD